MSGAGKSTIANIVEQRLHASGHHTMLLDGDNVRHGLNRDLGFTEADRVENIRRVGEVAKLMTEGGLIVLCSFISPYRAERDMVRGLVADGEFIEVFVDTPIEECIRRDPKGLYAKAKAGTIKNFTGFDAPYEPPQISRNPSACGRRPTGAIGGKGADGARGSGDSSAALDSGRQARRCRLSYGHFRRSAKCHYQSAVSRGRDFTEKIIVA